MPFAADRPSRTRGAVPSEDSAAAAQRQVWAAGCWAWLADQRAGRRTARRQRRRSERAVPTWPAAVRREGQPAMVPARPPRAGEACRPRETARCSVL